MAGKKLKIVPQYIRNVSKSTMYAASDVVSNIMPSVADFTQSNSDIFKAVTNDIRNFRSIAKQAKRQWDASDTAKSVTSIVDNLKEDIKTGNWYNKKREQQAILKATGFDDVFDMSDFNFDDFDIGDDGLGDSGSDVSEVDKLQVKASAATASAVQQNTMATMDVVSSVGRKLAGSVASSSEYIVQNQSAINSMNTINNTKMFNQINGVLNDMAMNVRGLFQYTGNITTYFNATSKMHEDMVNRLNEISALNKELTEMQRNLYAEYNKPTNQQTDKNPFLSSGSFNIADYFKTVMSRGKEMWETSMFGSSMNMMGGGEGNFLDTLAGSPAKFLATAIGNRLFSAPLQKSMKNFDKTFTTFFESMFLKMSSDLKIKGEDNAIWNNIYKLFGADLGRKQYTRTEDYTKGPVPFNGYSDKALTEVIPTYLRKILSAITGEKELIYNYKAGKFNTVDKIKAAYENDIDGTYSSVFYNKSKINEKLSKFQFNKRDQKVVDDDVNAFFRFLVDQGFFYNPDSAQLDTLRELGLELKSAKSFDLINAAFKSLDKTELMDLNSSIMKGIQTRKTSNDEINKELTQRGYSALFNGSRADTKSTAVMGLKITDDYNKTIFDYLRDIRTVLLEGIKVYSIQTIGKHARKYQGSGNIDKRMERYNTEVRNISNSTDSFYEDEAKLEQQALNTKKTYVSNLDLFNTDQETLAKSMRNIGVEATTAREGTESYKFLSRFKWFNPAESGLSKIAGIASDVASAPEKVLISLFDTINDNLLLFLYGSKNKDGKSVFEAMNDRIFKATDDITSWFKHKIGTPLKEALLGDHGLITNMKKRMTPVVERVKDQSGSLFANISNRFFGSDIDKMSPREFYERNISERMPKVGIGSGLGLIASFISPLGIIGGPLMGGALGFLSTSSRVKDTLFGKLGEDGTRTGSKYIPKSVIDTVNKSLKPVGIGAGIGALTGLLTPLGLVGTTLIGGVTGFLGSMDSVKNFLFGLPDANGERANAKEWQKKLKDIMPKAGLGAGIGALASVFLPGGPVGGAILGLSAGIASQSNAVKTFLFGDIDPETNKREGGLFGKLTTWMKVEVVDPLKIGVKKLFAKGGLFIKKNIVNPFLESLDPLKKQFELMRESVKDQMKAGWESTKTFVGNMFEKEVGKPFAQVIRENLLDPLKQFFGNIFRKLGSGFGKLISAPFKGLHNVSMGYMSEHEKSGNGDYVAEWKEKKYYRDKKMNASYLEKMDEVKNAESENEKVRRILEEGNYSNSAIKKAKELLRSDNDTVKSAEDKIEDNTSSIDKTVTGIYDLLKQTLRAGADAVVDTYNGIKGDIKISKRKKKHDKDKKARVDAGLPDIFYVGEDGVAGDGENSHASGLDNVPYDEYDAKLHKGEMVVPAKQANYIRRMLGLEEVEESQVQGELNDNNKIVNQLSELFGKSKNGILNKIYDKVSDIHAYLTKDNSITTPKGMMKEIKTHTATIAEAVDGQVNGVGYHTELIANILIDQFGLPSVMPKGVKAGVHRIKSKLAGFFKSPINFMKKVISAPFKFLGKMFEPLTNAVTKTISAIVQLPTTIVKTIGSVAKEGLKLINTLGKGIFGVVKGVFESIPPILNTLGTAAQETLKVLGAFGREIATGVGSAMKSLVSAAGSVAKSFIEVSSKAIPAFLGALAKTGKFITSSIGKIFGAITSPFRRKNKKIPSKIQDVKHVGEVDLIKKVNLVQRVESVGVLEKIGDNRLFSKLDKIVLAIRGSLDPAKQAGEEVQHETMSLLQQTGTNLTTALSSIPKTITESVNKSLGKSNENQQVAMFKKKEQAETLARKTKEMEALQTASFKAETGTYEILKDAFGGKGLFGMLKTALPFIIGFFGKIGSKLMKFLTNPGSMLDGLISKIGNKISGKTAKKAVGEIAEDVAEGTIKKGASSVVKNSSDDVARAAVGKATSKASKKGLFSKIFKKGAGETVEHVAAEVVENVPKSAMRNGASNIIENVSFKVAGDAITDPSRLLGSVDDVAKKVAQSAATDGLAANPSIISKILNSAPVKKLAGTKIGAVLPKLSKALTSKMKNAGTKVFAKLSAKWGAIIGSGAISGMAIPAIWFGGNLINDMTKTNQVFGMAPSYKPSMTMRLISGFSCFLVDNLTLGIVPASWIANFLGGLLLSDEENDLIDQGKEQLEKDHEAYMAETGDQITLSEYNEKVNKSLFGKTWDGIKNVGSGIKKGATWVGGKVKDGAVWAGNKITGNAFNDSKIRELMGLSDDEDVTFGDRAATGISGVIENLTLGFIKQDKTAKTLKELPGKVLDKGKEIWGTLETGFGKAKEKVLDGVDTFDAGLGALFGLESKDGEPIKLSEWGKEKLDDAYTYVRDLGSKMWGKAKDMWGKTKQFFSDFSISDILENADSGLGSLFGLEDDQGNPLKLSTWASNGFHSAMDGIKSVASSASSKAKEIFGKVSDKYSEIKGKIGEGVDKLDTGIASMFGIVGEDGEPVKFSDWAGGKIKDGMSWVADKAKDAIEEAGNIFDKVKNTIAEKAKGIDEKVGSFFGLEDDDGNDVGVTGWIGNKWNNFKQGVAARKNRGAGNGGQFALSQPTPIPNCVPKNQFGAGNGVETTSQPSTGGLINGAVYYSQNDKRWADKDYGDSSMGRSGCGPTSAAMLISSVTGQAVSPYEAAQWSLQHNYRVPGQGTAWAFFPEYGKQFGVDLRATTNYEDVKAKLASGYPAILSGKGPKPFTSGGHLLMATGMTADGKILINDPVSEARSIAYDFNSIVSNTRQAWVSDKPLTGGVPSGAVSSVGDITGTSGTSEEDNGIGAAIAQIGKYTMGFINSAIVGEEFDASKYEEQTQEQAAGVSSIGEIDLSGYDGSPTSADLNFSSLTPIGTSAKGNTTYGSDAIRDLPGGNSEFIKLIAPQAIRNQSKFGIPASTTMAQAIVESGWGKRAIGNNILGIKEGSYKGPVVSTKTKEHGIGAITDTFRGYNGINESLYDHSKNVIAGNPQWYSNVINSNWEASIDGLRPYYATDPNYTNTLKSVVRSNNLTQYNNMASGSNSVRGAGGLTSMGQGGEFELTQPKTVAKPINSQEVLYQQFKDTNNRINDALTADKIFKSSGGSVDKIDKIISLLQKISNNTEETAANTREIADKDFTVNISQENSTDKKSNQGTNANQNVKNPMTAISENRQSSRINSAYENAKRISIGVYE